MNYNSDKKNILKEFVYLSGSRYVSEFLFSIKGIIIVGLLGPALYGVWTIIKTFLAMSEYSCLGALRGMVREIPISAANKKDDMKITQSSGFTFGLIITVLVSLIFFGLSFTRSFSNFKIEAQLASIVFILAYIYYFVKLKLQSENKIKSFTTYQFLYAILTTGFGLLLTYLWSLKGLLISLLITYLIIISVLIIKKYYRFEISFDKNIIKKLVKVGSPILFITFIFFMMFRIDSLIVYFFIGAKEAGYYGLASLIIIMTNHIPGSLAQVLFPKMMFNYGSLKNNSGLENYYIKPLIILAVIISILLSIIFLNTEFIVKEFLPKYLPSITVIKILLGSLFFASLLTMPVNILIAMNKHKKIIPAALFIVIVQTITNIILVRSGFGFTAIAYISLISFFAASIFINAYTLRSLQRTTTEILILISKFILPFIYSASVTFVIYNLIYISKIEIINNIIQTISFLILTIPLLLYFKKDKIISKIFLTPVKQS